MDNPFLRGTEEQIILSLSVAGLTARKAENDFFSRFDYFIREGMKKYNLLEEDAFDAYSDAVLAVIKGIRNGNFEGRSSLKTYTFQVFQNKCVDLVRKKATNKNSVHKSAILPELISGLSDGTKSILQQLSEKTDFDVLTEKLRTLGDKCREILLCFSQGQSDRELATVLGYKTADVVKTSRLRCLEKLRQVYLNERKS